MYPSLVTFIYPFILSTALAAPAPIVLSSVLEAPTPEKGFNGTSELSSSREPPSKYYCYRGLEFPQPADWASFEALRAINYATLGSGNTPETVAHIINEIQSVASEAQIDPRIVLAQIMQESRGQMHKAGDGGRSIGLMQVQMLNGESGIVCASGTCSRKEIHDMIAQGVLGTTRGDGPVEPGIGFYLQRFDVGTSLRWYNTGGVPNEADLSVATPISTESYVSDVANRLRGLAPDAAYPDPMCQFALPTLF